ncbi:MULTISPECIES: dynamin family protein [Acinetobacter]|nr:MULTISPECIES: dynamin family protein [Acinetobacter]
MNTSVDTLREEAQTLLELEKNLLSQMSEKGVLDHANEQNQATLDTTSVQQELMILRGEALKVTELEMVLAVVGTMKAGKSTTINAIVGREILPNRNAPMTAIPTLIKHRKGQKQPHLTFSKKASQPANQLVRDLKKCFQQEQYTATLEKLRTDKDLYLTVERIQQGIKVVNDAVGEKQIFDFLVSINDLVRIAPHFDLEFPFDQYQEVDQLPVIEVEFAHLQEMEEQGGKLILLDTPGPNEAGQTHLRPMLQDQLKKASAVLAVMDYTQLKSEADAQVREDIQSIAHTAKNRIYALVNKFDNCDRNGMKEPEVKTFVEGLTEGVIKQENTYPVAAKWAYLANRAKNERFEDGSLPDVESNGWVEDFYDEAGLRRESHRTPERIAEAIDDLWQDSLFSQPLKEVIAASHQKAAFVALDSAVDKLDECSEKINTVLSVKETAIHKTTDELQRVITQLEQDIASIDDTQDQAENSIQGLQNNFSLEINQFIHEQFEDVKSTIIQKTSEGNEQTKKLEKNKTTISNENKGVVSFIKRYMKDKAKRFFGFGNAKINLEKGHIEYDSKNPILDFGEDKTAATDFLKQIGEILPVVNMKINQEVEKQLDTLLEDFESEFKDKILVQAQKSIQKVNQTLSTGGFDDIQLSLPSHKQLALKTSSAKMMKNVMNVKSHQETRSRVVDSAWGRFKNWFSDDWGREDYTVTVKNYTIDMNKVSEEIQVSLAQSQKEIQTALQKEINAPLKQASYQFFKVFKQKIMGLTADIQNSLDAKQQFQQNEQEAMEMILALKKECQNIQARTQQLKSIVLQKL